MSDDNLAMEDFDPAPDAGTEAARSEARPFPDAVRSRARSGQPRAAAPNQTTQVEVRKAREGSRAALASSRVKVREARGGTSAFDGGDGRDGGKGASGGKGDRMARSKKKRRIGIIRLGVIMAVCAVVGTYAGLYLQQLFNDALPKSSVYEQTSKAPPPSSGFTF